AQIGGSYVIRGINFGDEQGHSTVTLGGQELEVKSWSDTEIHVKEIPNPVGTLVMVTTPAGTSNALSVDGLVLDPAWEAELAARSVYVDAANTGPEDGSPAHPWNTITEALDHLPSLTPRYVFVAPGTYYEHVRIAESDIWLLGSGPHETIINGLTPASLASQGFSNGAGPTIYIGAGGETGSVQNIVISGFTITGGTVDDDIGAGIFGDYGNRNIDINNNFIVRNGGYYGGGIWFHYSNHDVKIWSNTIAENGNYGGYGGGISVNDEPEYPANADEHGEPEHVVDDACPPTCAPTGTYEIYNNHIHHNYSPDYGGGIALYELKDHLKVYGNVIEENKAEDHGGGAFFEDTGPVDVYENQFLRNHCSDDGGALSFEDVGNDIATVRVYNNLFAENVADDHGENHARGGAISFDDTFHAEVFNNTIVGNIVAGSHDPVGGAIDSERNGHEYNGSEPNGRDVAPGFSDVKIYNNIIWDNWRLEYDQPGHTDEEDLDYTWGENYRWTPDNLHVDNPALQPPWESFLNSESLSHVQYNIIANDEYAGQPGNLNLDPLFVAPGTFLFPTSSGPQLMLPGSDWHLLAGSPAIDSAPLVPGLQTDLDTHPRSPRHGMFDRGAYEYQWPNPGSITIVKEANPANGTDFTFHGDLGGFTLDDANPDDNDAITQTITYAGLVSDTYVITESIPSGWWTLLGIGCTAEPDTGGLFTLISDTNDSLIGVAVHLQADQSVVCTFTNDRPNAITLDTMQAIVRTGQIELHWTTLSEVDTVGFNVMRSASADGPFTAMNDHLILSRGDAFSGASYHFVDNRVADGATYRYYLQEVLASGEVIDHTEQTIAVTAKAWMLYLPAIFK
ncbi:MAG: hypothetical protein D6796_15175, partial [Caldilineae bacterium]